MAEVARRAQSVRTGQRQRQSRSRIAVRKQSRLSRSTAVAEELPEHPELHRGTLSNGLKYVILPNKVPPARFEAHLEVRCGSVDEGVHEQGIAHLVEHITFLGSPMRERLIGSGAKSNAFTDFHHTVFHIHSPLQTNISNDMLKYCLTTLEEVAFRPQFSQRRFDKERSAVQNEASMMNTMDYRLDCKRLEGLHGENNVGYRFPIGKLDCIQQWSVEDPQEFHRRFYYPGNAAVYVVGDFGERSIDDVVAEIDNVFGAQPAGSLDAAPSKPAALPAVVHSYGMSAVQQSRVNKLEGNLTQADAPPDLFKHQLLQQYNLNIFSKLPLFPVKTREDLRWAFMARLVVCALQFRLSSRCGDLEQQSINIDLDYSDSSREGCTVTALTVDSEAADWEQATRIAIEECSKLARGGITHTELDRYTNMLLLDSEQLAEQTGTIPSADTLDFVMESEAVGHTVMDQVKGHELMKEVSQEISLEDVNDTCMEILGFISEYGTPVEERDPRAGYTTSLVVCAPDELAEGTPFELSAEDVESVMLDPEARHFVPVEDVQVPDRLLTDEHIEVMRNEMQPQIVSVSETPIESEHTTSMTSASDENEIYDTPIYQRVLSNGMAVNVKHTNNEPSGAAIRLVAAGGRMLEGAEHKYGSVAVGAQSLQEAGAAGGYTREQVELFCMSRLLMLEIAARQESVTIDATFATSKDGMRAALELLHILVSEPSLSESAVERTKQQLISSAQALPKSLERYGPHIALSSLLENGDKRMLDPYENDVANVSLDDAKAALNRHFAPNQLELNIVGDVDIAEIDPLLRDIVGTIQLPHTHRAEVPAVNPAPRTRSADGLRHHSFVLNDSDERGNAWIAGPAPHKWMSFAGTGTTNAEETRRSSPYFCIAALTLLSEIVSSRLFGRVRDGLGLTYDVTFSFANNDLSEDNWYTLSVTSMPEKVDRALDACKEVLRSLPKRPPSKPEVDKAIRTVTRRFEGETKDNQQWLNLMTNSQNELVPGCSSEYGNIMPQMVAQMEPGDLERVLDEFTFSDNTLVTVRGVAGNSHDESAHETSGNGKADSAATGTEAESSAAASAAA